MSRPEAKQKRWLRARIHPKKKNPYTPDVGPLLVEVKELKGGARVGEVEGLALGETRGSPGKGA